MAGILKVGLETALRHNIASLWQKTLLFCPRSKNVLGGQELIEALIREKPPYPIGVASPGDKSLEHTFITMNTDDASNRWFDFWIRERHFWWKWHSVNRERFVDMRIDSDHREIRYLNKLRETELVETLTRDTSNPDVLLIRSQIDLDATARILQRDAYDDTTPDNTTSLWRLHYKLAPYQVSVSVCSEKLLLRATELLTQLKRIYIRCLPEVHLIPADVDPSMRFAVEDALGVCFNVYFDEEGQQNQAADIVNIRNRDTATSEALFESQVASTLARYLRTEAVPIYKGTPRKIEVAIPPSVQIIHPKKNVATLLKRDRPLRTQVSRAKFILDRSKTQGEPKEAS